MILLLTNKEDITADFVVLELQKRGVDYFRFNTEDFPKNVQISIDYANDFSGFFSILKDKKRLLFKDIKSVWYRRPVLPVPDTKIPDRLKSFCIKESFAALNGVWANLDCFWISNPRNIYNAESKITQLIAARQLGFNIPNTIISNNPEDISDFYYKLKANIIIKPIKTGFINDESVIFTNKISPIDIHDIQDTALVPSIYQENINKRHDIRITVVGEKVFPVEIHSQDIKDATIDWRHSKNLNMTHKLHNLPENINNKCLKLVQALGLEFGAIDMVLTPNEEYYFLEINPNGQWAWIEKRTGLKITEAITNLLVCEGLRHEKV